MRGKAVNNLLHVLAAGITPACAGKSCRFVVQLCASGDHPRMCGEKEVTETGAPVASGITPACAGKSGSNFLELIHYKDHPRMCGEKLL